MTTASSLRNDLDMHCDAAAAFLALARSFERYGETDNADECHAECAYHTWRAEQIAQEITRLVLATIAA